MGKSPSHTLHAIGRISAAPEPAYMRVSSAVAWSGISRSRLYEILAGGQVHCVKAGGATLIQVASLRSYLESLPAATFRTIARAA